MIHYIFIIYDFLLVFKTKINMTMRKITNLSLYGHFKQKTFKLKILVITF